MNCGYGGDCSPVASDRSPNGLLSLQLDQFQGGRSLQPGPGMVTFHPMTYRPHETRIQSAKVLGLPVAHEAGESTQTTVSVDEQRRAKSSRVGRELF